MRSKCPNMVRLSYQNGKYFLPNMLSEVKGDMLAVKRLPSGYPLSWCDLLSQGLIGQNMRYIGGLGEVNIIHLIRHTPWFGGVRG